MPSSVTLVAGFIPLYRNFRYHFTSLDYHRLVSRDREREREREIRWNRLVLEKTTRVAKTEREREREKPTRLVLFGNLLVSHCEEFTWPPGSRFVELCNRLDSTRFDFSFQVADKSLQRVFLDARKRTIDDIIDNKRRLRARKMRAWNCFICKDNFMLARVNVH